MTRFSNRFSQLQSLKGDLLTLPQVGTTITEVYRAGRFSQGVNKPPPPVVVKFTSPNIRMAVLKNKRTNMPLPTEVGAKRFIIVEDLTPATYRKLQELAGDDRVDKAWTIGPLEGIYGWLPRRASRPLK